MAALLACMALIAGCVTTSELQRAESLVERGRYEDAIKLYQSIIETKPGTDEARKAKLEIGDIYFKKMKQTDKGIQVYLEVAKEYPNTEEGAEALWNVAGYYYKQGDLDKAIELFGRIVKEFPSTKRAGNAQYMVAKCWELKAEKLEKEGANTDEIETAYSRAAEEYGKLAKMFPDHPQVPQALRNQGFILEKLNKTDEAIEAYKQLVQRFSERPETKPLVSEVQEKLKQMGVQVEIKQRRRIRSEQDFRRAIMERRKQRELERRLRDVPPDQRDVILGLKKAGPGQQPFRSSFGVDPDALMKQVNFTLDNQGTLYDAMYMFANMYYSEGRYKEAGALYERAIDLGLKDPQAFVRLAMCYKHEGMEDKAKETLQKAARRDPKVVDVIITSGQRWYEAEEYEKALETFKTALGLSKVKDPEVYYNIGLTYRKMGKDDEAIEIFEKAVAMKPNYTDALQHLAELYYYKKGDRELGLAFNDAAQEKAYTYEVQKALGDLCFKHGSYNWARIKYNTAARLASTPEAKLLMKALAAAAAAKKGDIARAQNELDALSQENPDAAPIHYLKGEIAVAQNELQKAEAEFKKALEIDPTLEYAALALGELYIKQGKEDEALKLWEGFLQENPKARLVAWKLNKVKKAEESSK